MAKSEKKRIEGKKPTSRKSQLKFAKRMTENFRVLSKLSV